MGTRVKSSPVSSKAAALARRRAAERAEKPRETKAQRAARQMKLDSAADEACEWVCSWEFELAARAEGSTRIAGVDEVGRGPLFGPVVAAAVILPEGAELDGLNDSKKLTEEAREHFNEVVRRLAVCWAIAEVDVATIDRINILQASRLAMRLAVERLAHSPDHLLIDGNQKIEAVCRQTTIVQGDGRSLSIAAASVIAKVHRDRLLCELDARFPGYGLASNKGYSTPEHKRALRLLGATEMHRRSFAPVAQVMGIDLIDLEFDWVESAGDVLEEELDVVDQSRIRDNVRY